MIENSSVILAIFLVLFAIAVILMIYNWLYITQVAKIQSQTAIQIPKEIKNLLLLTVGLTTTSLIVIILLVGLEII